MAIRPLDMQVMIPKLQEVSHMKQLEQQKAGINQQDIGSAMERRGEKSLKTVEKSNQDEALNNQSDAKEEGKGKYYSSNKKKSEAKKDEGDTTLDLPKHRIDIKI